MDKILFNTHDLALIITIYLCLLFSLFLLIRRKQKRNSNVLLACFLIIFAAIPLDTLINFGASFRSHILEHSPDLFYVFDNAYWLEAPLLLFYVRSLVHKEFKFKKTDIFYFLPFVTYFLYQAQNWYFIDASTKLEILTNNQSVEDPTVTLIMNLFRECFRVFCGLVCIKELYAYQKQLKDEMSTIEQDDLSWLRILVAGFVFIRLNSLVVIALFVISTRVPLPFSYEILGLLSNFATLFLISGLIYFSLGYAPIFNGLKLRIDTGSPVKKEPFSSDTVNKIIQYVEQEKPYLNQLLTIENLAKQIAVSPKLLSQIINQHFEKNFYEFINGYRIDESKRLIAQPEYRNATMLTIMAEAGFNSKATFYTFFKKYVKMTPTQYRESIAVDVNNDCTLTKEPIT